MGIRMGQDDNTWSEWCRYVLETLKSHGVEIKALRTDCEKCRANMRTEIADIKRQVAVQGVKVALICGGLTLAITLGAKYLLG